MPRPKKPASPPTTKGRKPTECPVSRKEFAAKAKGILVVVNPQMIDGKVVGGLQILLDPRTFSTGSLGWNGGGKLVTDVGGTPVKVQMCINFMIAGSKEMPKDEEVPEEPTPTETEEDEDDPEVVAARLLKNGKAA